MRSISRMAAASIFPPAISLTALSWSGRRAPHRANLVPSPSQDPTHRQIDHPLAIVLAGKAIELLHGSDILIQARRLELRVLLANIIAGEACVPA